MIVMGGQLAPEYTRLPDKIVDSAFCVEFKDNTEITQDNLEGHGKKIRVFNSDFLRENLKFIINPDESIEPFAILGERNIEIEQEIKKIEIELGSHEKGKESGLFSKLKVNQENLNLALSNYQSRLRQLDNLLNAKATDRKTGIKYKAEKFGDQNYSRPKLDRDILLVLDTSFKPISDIEQSEFEHLLSEKIHSPIPPLPEFSLKFETLSIESEHLVKQKVSDSNKIEELVRDAVLNKWVKEGHQLHRNTRTKCAFCNNKILEGRWAELDKHFDEESEKLENAIIETIKKIDEEITIIEGGFNINKERFYLKFHSIIDRLTLVYQETANRYIINLNNLKKQLEARKDDLIKSKVFNQPLDLSKRLSWIIDIYERIRNESNAYSDSLERDQDKAKSALRLREVFDFINTINYLNAQKVIKDLKSKLDDAIVAKDKIANEISKKSRKIEKKKRELKDESRGVDKVNVYLNNFFGHGFLSLEAIEAELELDETIKKFKFEVIREGKKAYHLSEGECSLIAFCYFMAKLDDIETKGSKPIL